MELDIEVYYEKYAPMVIRRCRKMLGNEEDALDAAQDVFVNLAEARKRLRGSYPSSLLYTMATNVCLNRLRWKKRHTETSQELDEEGLFTVDHGYAQVEAKLLMEAILRNESESTRTICFMYHGDGMTLQEIGAVLGMSVSGIRKRLIAFQRRARIHGAELLEQTES